MTRLEPGGRLDGAGDGGVERRGRPKVTSPPGPRLGPIVPRLPVADLGRATTFYRDRLGFVITTLWPDVDPTFAIVESDGVGIGFFVGEGDRQRIGYAELYIEVSDAQTLCDGLHDHVAIEWGVEVYSYGRREFAIRDPDDYLIIFTEQTE